MPAKVLTVARPTAKVSGIILLVLLAGCGEVVETSWKPHVIALTYSKNGQLMKGVTEHDSPFPSIYIEDGDRLEFHSFTCQLFPTSKTSTGLYIVQKRDLPPVPEEATFAEMRVLVTPPARRRAWRLSFVEEYDEKDTLTTDWVPLRKESWGTPALKQPLVANTKWYYLKVQVQVRSQWGEIVDVAPEWYVRFHIPGLLGH